MSVVNRNLVNIIVGLDVHIGRHLNFIELSGVIEMISSNERNQDAKVDAIAAVIIIAISVTAAIVWLTGFN